MDNAARWENPTKISDPTLYHWRCERRWAARDRRLDRLVLRCLSTAAGLMGNAFGSRPEFGAPILKNGLSQEAS